MLPELSVLKASLTRESYNVVNSIIEITDLPQEIRGIYRCLQSFYEGSDEPSITIDSLANLFFSTTPKERDYFIGVFENLQQIEATKESVVALCSSLRRQNLLRSLSMAAYNASEGNQKEYEEVVAALKALDSPVAVKTDEFEYVSSDLNALLEKTYLKPGLRWRLNSLNRALGSLRKATFGFVFARPESGKTTFLTSEGSYFAEQAVEQGLGPVLHMNNEGEDDNILLRYYQAVLGASLPQILANREKAERLFRDKTQDKIIIPRAGNFSKKQFEWLLERHKPCIAVVDQADHIQGFDADREDLKMGAIYEWLRELAKEYCPIIAVTQADGTGEGAKWLTMANVANAKTAKQAAADWILGIGKLHDPNYDNIRFLNLSKNKLLGDPDTDAKLRHHRWEVLMEQEVARYKDFNERA